MAVCGRDDRFPANAASRVLRSSLFPRHRKGNVRQRPHHFAGGNFRGLDGFGDTVSHDDVCSRRAQTASVFPESSVRDYFYGEGMLRAIVRTGAPGARRFVRLHPGLPFAMVVSRIRTSSLPIGALATVPVTMYDRVVRFPANAASCVLRSFFLDTERTLGRNALNTLPAGLFEGLTNLTLLYVMRMSVRVDQDSESTHVFRAGILQCFSDGGFMWTTIVGLIVVLFDHIMLLLPLTIFSGEGTFPYFFFSYLGVVACTRPEGRTTLHESGKNTTWGVLIYLVPVWGAQVVLF